MQTRDNKVTKECFLKAAKKGNVSVVSRYIEENNNSPDAINVTDERGCSALILAIKSRKPDGDCREVINILLEIPGINLEFTDKKGNTALMLVAKHDENELFCKLIKSGANVNAINMKGDTALILAVKEQNYFLVTLLLLQKKLNLDLDDQGVKALLAAGNLAPSVARFNIHKTIYKHMTSLQIADITAERTATLLTGGNARFFSPPQQQNTVTSAVTQLTALPKP